jgi:hypothetical protein
MPIFLQALRDGFVNDPDPVLSVLEPVSDLVPLDLDSDLESNSSPIQKVKMILKKMKKRFRNLRSW